MSKYELTLGIQEQALIDILTIAAEGGIGYWANYSTRRNDEHDVTALVDIRDSEDEEAFFHTIEASDIAVGITLALHSQYFNENLTRQIALEILDWDNSGGCIVDADIADVFVQFACFGEVVYG